MPFTSIDKFGELSGYGIDLANAIGKTLEYKIEFRLIPFNALENEIDKNTLDIVIAPIDSNNQKNLKNNIIYSKPYYYNKLTMLINSVSKDKFLSEKFVRGTKLCLPNKPYILDYIRKHYLGTKIMLFEGSRHSVDALYKNECDAIIDTKSSNEYYRTKHKLGKLECLPIPDAAEYDHPYRIAMSSRNSKLKDKIDDAIVHLIQTGELNKIHRKWFQSNLEIREEDFFGED